MPLFEADPETEAIVIYTEPGGRMEAELARWVTENNSRLPIVAFMAGRFMDEMPGMSFGHAGTIVEGKEDTATEKIARLAEAGIVVAEEISEIPEIVKEKIGSARCERGAVHRRRGRRHGRRRPRARRASSPRSARSTSSRRNDDGTLEIVEENLDECVLCELCMNAAPAGTVRVVKLYSGETLPRLSARPPVDGARRARASAAGSARRPVQVPGLPAARPARGCPASRSGAVSGRNQVVTGIRSTTWTIAGRSRRGPARRSRAAELVARRARRPGVAASPRRPPARARPRPTATP